jgi:hypothetical protein
MDDPWLYSDQAGELALVKGETWARRARDPASRVPAEGRRCPTTGRPQWRTSAVEAYVEQRNRPAAQALHDSIVSSLRDREWTVEADRDIAETLGVHPRTVFRHLSGECACK